MDLENELNNLVLNTIIDLRQKVLYPAGQKNKVIYLKDKDIKTVHFLFWSDRPDLVVFNFNELKDKSVIKNLIEFNNLIGTGTLIAEDESERTSDAQWRIRGMAVDPLFQGQGIGQKIVKAMVNYVKDNKPSDLIWCNARVEALTLYQRFGFSIESEVFMISGSGPHRRLHLKL